MATKVKGLLKGLRYISQIFDEEKKPEMEIGFPTDVKHVAHIGWDGPTSVESPSWMKEFPEAGGGHHSGPLSVGDQKPKDNPEIKWVSEDSPSRKASRLAADSQARDLPELPKSTRRLSSTENSSGTGSPRKEKSRNSRRHHSKDSSDAAKSNRHIQQQQQDGSAESVPKNLPDIPKKSRRKKSRENIVGVSGSSKSRSKGTATTTYNSSSFSDSGNDAESSVRSLNKEDRESSRVS